MTALNFELQSAFLFGVVWSIGGITDYEGRQKFDQFLREIASGKNEAYQIPKLIQKIEIPFPEAATVYDYFYEVCAII